MTTKTFTHVLLSLAIALGCLALIGGPAQAARGGRADGPVVAVGDSIVQGVGTSMPDSLSWPARIGAVRAGQAGGCVISVGCFNTAPMVSTYDAAVLAQRPSVIFVAYGINDIAVGAHTPAEIVDGLADLVTRGRAAGARVYVQTLTPLGPRVSFLDAARVQVNDLIRSRFGASVVDLDTAMTNARTGQLKWSLDSGDNLHPNAAGYRVMAAAARAVLAAA